MALTGPAPKAVPSRACIYLYMHVHVLCIHIYI